MTYQDLKLAEQSTHKATQFYQRPFIDTQRLERRNHDYVLSNLTNR